MDKKAKLAIAMGIGSMLGTCILMGSALVAFVANPGYRAAVTDYIRYYGEVYEQQFGDTTENPYKDLLDMIDEALPPAGE